MDFEAFSIKGLALTTEVAQSCIDSFVATGATGLATPTICGLNAGQHIYLDFGPSSTAQATLAFTFATTSTITTQRQWDIRASQIPCGSNYRPPVGCLQYHTGLTGSFQTFNYLESATPGHLSEQE